MPAPKLLRLRALLAAVALLGACAALVPAAARTYAATAKDLRRVVRSPSTRALEQRRRAALARRAR